MSIVIKPFQKATVNAVMQGLHRPDGEGRFLVADEVGLGKTVVAQGVIAEMLARHGKLIVFYIANGRRVASQNATRLIPDKKTRPMIADRLGLLHQQRTFETRNRGKLELYTFTPETSLKIRGSGRWEERAFLRQLLRMAFTKRAADVVVEPRRKDGWEQQSVQYARRHMPSKKLTRTFRRVLKLRYGSDPLAFLTQQNRLHPSRITVLLRRAVAEAELQMNAPDLIIFDEFQNYRRLLFSRLSLGGNEEERRLVDRMLKPLSPTASPKVLLLSATPFRIYATQWQESQEPGHTREIFDLVRFLGGETVETDIRSKFPEFSKALYEFATVPEERATEFYAKAEEKRDSLERSLKQIMSRTERKSSLGNRPDDPESSIVVEKQDFATFRHLARVLGAGTQSRHRHEAVAFWSSVPLAAQVLGASYVGWKAGRKRLRRIAPGPHLKSNNPARGDEALTAHPKLRKLYRINHPTAAALPWVAPSQPWWPLGKAWQTQEGSVLGPEKLLLFSHFRATPQSIAALSSLASEQSIGKEAHSKRRQFNPRADRMAIFALFQPMTWLIQTAEPTKAAGGTFADTRKTVRGQLEAELRSTGKGYDVAVSPKALTGKDNGGSAPKPPLCSVQSSCEDSSSRSESESESSTKSVSPLESAADAARSKEEMLAALATRYPVPSPPSKEALAPPPTSAAPRPTTPFQIAKALVEETKRSAWDTYLRAYSLAYQLAGYLEERKAKGEKAYAFDHWAVLYTADFIDALNRGWRFKDIEDAIDAAQTTKYRFVCCTPFRLFENGESVMKLVYALRRTGKTVRQKLSELYPSWYLDNAGSYAVEEMKRTVEDEVAEEQRSAEDERQRETELDEDVPILALATTGKVKCINPDCPYRFDTRELMRRHFKECFQKAVEVEPIDTEDALREQLEDEHDDKYGIIPCSYYHWYEEDEKAGRWDRYAPENVDGGMMFDPWADEDAACVAGTEAQHEI